MIHLEFALSELADALSDGRLTSVALTEECFRRIDQQKHADPFVYLDYDGAMAAARESDARRGSGGCLGVLDGIPFVAEDRFCVKGQPTENHCGMLRGYKPPYDAHAISRLRGMGAVLLGKLQTDGFLSGRIEHRNVFQNLIGKQGVVPFALMAETGGSLLRQGRDCAVAYFSRSISRYGMISCAPSFDGVGVLASSAKDCRFLIDFLADGFDRESAEAVCSSPKIALWGWEEGPLFVYTENCRAVELPNSSELVRTYRILSAVEAASEMAMCDGIRFGVGEANEENARERTAAIRGKCFSSEEQGLILLGTALLMGEHRLGCYSAARGARERLQRDLCEVFEKYDLLVCPLTDRTVCLAALGGLSVVSEAGMLWMTPQGRETALFRALEQFFAERGVC